ncbi:hypothetical protein Bpfe_002353 [Biomphalaria pfeifferi]|uniref:Uncharacterized protein n=1 Tax=Biomphalaria pfeifferi TaxID=112525 RepID=A0AAD8FLK3_BIOPF|nr:hypothetical protein Bpfe_002353 [Biomphalaria pfeifferi]
MVSDDSVTGPYCHTFTSSKSWAVMSPSSGYLATHFPSLKSWAAKTPSRIRIVYGDTHSSTEIMRTLEINLFL